MNIFVFCTGNGAKTDSTQEMIAVGAGSIFCSFFGCIPLTASFSRSSVLSASGGKTQFASLINGKYIYLVFMAPNGMSWLPHL